jgi:hypothetical protein
MLATEPPPGITCWQEKDQMDDLRARTYHVMPVMTVVNLLKLVLKCKHLFVLQVHSVRSACLIIFLP